MYLASDTFQPHISKSKNGFFIRFQHPIESIYMNGWVKSSGLKKLFPPKTVLSLAALTSVLLYWASVNTPELSWTSFVNDPTKIPSHRLRRLEKLRLKVADLFKETIVGFFCQLLFFLRSGFKFEPHQILQTFLQSWDTAEHKLAFTYHHFHCSHLPKKTFIITCRSLESLSPRYCRRPSDSRRFLSVNLQPVTFPDALFTWQINAIILMIMYCPHCLKYFCMSVFRTWPLACENSGHQSFDRRSRPRQKKKKKKQTEYASSQKKSLCNRCKTSNPKARNKEARSPRPLGKINK